MKTIYLFDVDGTLTPARQPMEDSFREFFVQFSETFPVYFITGSDRPKLDEQLPADLRARAKGIFTCAGTQFWNDEDLVYERHHEFDETLIKTLEGFVENSPFVGRYGNHLEYRTGMVNVSVPGRNVSREGRAHYYNWDKEHGERKSFLTSLKRLFPDYSAAAGGQISVDVSPNGWTKAQALEKLKGWHPKSRFVFFGDRMNEGGNDRPLAEVMWADSEENQAINVDGPEHTQRMLEMILSKPSSRHPQDTSITA